MIEKTPRLPTTKEFLRGIRNAATILAISFTLTNCSSPEEKYEKQLQKVQELEYALQQQERNYHSVASQWEIQDGLRKEWADPSINQEIWYSIDRAKDQDKEIYETKKELAKAQRKLAKMKEEIEFREARRVAEHSETLNPNKYEYIPEEFKRSRKAK